MDGAGVVLVLVMVRGQTEVQKFSEVR